MKDRFSSTITKGLIPYSLPENWAWFFWKDIMKSYQQGMIRSNSELGEGNVSYLKMGDINSSGTANLAKLKRTYASDKEIKEFELNEGDFLINVRNSLELVGKTCVIDKLINNTVLFNHMLVRIDNGSLELNYFLNAYLNTPVSKKLISKVKEGTTTIIALYQREINKLPIALPDEITFNLIVDLYRSIRLKIELNNRINAELEAMAKTLYDYWFVQFDFPMSRAHAEKIGKPELAGKPYKSSGGSMVYNAELKREIPEGWEVKKIKEELEAQYGFPFSTKLFNEEGTGCPVIRIRDILNNSISIYSTEKAEDKYRLEKGDLLIGMDGNFHMNFWDKNDCYLNQRCVRIRKKADSRVSLFQALFSSKPYIKARETNVSRTTVGHLSAKDIDCLYVLVPDSSLLVNKSKVFDNLLDKLISNRNQNQHLSALRDWLLPMLMNGQVSVKEAEEKLDMAAETETKYQAKVKTLKPTNVDYYKRTVLAAEIVWQLHREPTLGHLKLQKLIYLCQRTANMQLPVNFLKQAMGPYDPQMMRSIDKQLKIKAWFQYKKTEFLKYVPLNKAGQHQNDFIKYFSDEQPNIQFIIDTFKNKKSDIIEITATLYACLEEMCEKNIIYSESMLLKMFYEWSERKVDFSEMDVKRVFKAMQAKGILPKAFKN